MLRTASGIIEDELRRRGWPYEVLDGEAGFFRFVDGSGRKHMIKFVRSRRTSTIEAAIMNDKWMSYLLAKEIGVRVPATIKYDDLGQAVEFMRQHQPVVVKPRSSAHGKGVSINIRTAPQLKRALKVTEQHGLQAIIQEQHKGTDYRLLYIGGKLVAAVSRMPAAVEGDGRRTVEQLIAAANAAPERNTTGPLALEKIPVDSARDFLGRKVNMIPAKGEKVAVTATANVSTGGFCVDVTDTLDPQLVADGQALIDALGVGLCGIDFLWEGAGHRPVFLEMNISPGLDLHEWPHVGAARPVTAAFIDWVVSDE